MKSKPHRSRSPEPGTRSRAAVLAVTGWWLAAVLGIVGWQLLSAVLAADQPAEPSRWGQVGTWSLGFAALSALAGWVGSIGAVLHDHGRIRVGAILLMVLPLLALVVACIAVSSTVVLPDDPLFALWLVGSGMLLAAGTLLICLPGYLGTT